MKSTAETHTLGALKAIDRLQAFHASLPCEHTLQETGAACECVNGHTAPVGSGHKKACNTFAVPHAAVLHMVTHIDPGNRARVSSYANREESEGVKRGCVHSQSAGGRIFHQMLQNTAYMPNTRII